MTPKVAPPRWTPDEFDRDLAIAIGEFKRQRLEEDPAEYFEVFDRKRAAVETLLEATVDLSQIAEVACDIAADADLFEALRYLAAPPISADDIKVLADVNTLTASRLRADPKLAEKLVETVIQALDRRRFVWVAEDREPTEAEREAAAMASAALITTQRIATDRRSNEKRLQEEAVAACLESIEFVQVPTRNIETLRDAPQPGEFCRETIFGGRKADLVVSLHDGRVMAIECKASNSATNSVKRLNNDAAVKAKTWLRVFGEASTVPAAVLSGVFKRINLVDAQDDGLTIFWAHSLSALASFVKSAR